MKTTIKRFIMWTLLFIASLASAQIEVIAGGVGGGSFTMTGGTPTSGSAPAAATLDVRVGDTIIAAVSINGNTTPSVSGCGQTWITPGRVLSNLVQQIWYVPHATVANPACNVTVTGLAGTSAFIVQIFRNVLSVGTPNMISTSTTGQTTLNAPAMTASVAGSLIVGFFATYKAPAPTFTEVSPTVSFRRPTSPAAALMGGVTSTSAGQQVIVSYTSSSALDQLLRGAVELVPAPTNRDARLTDAMQTIVMRTARNMDYELNPSVLSPTWCTWFMPAGASSHTYELAPKSTEINGQTNDIRIPSWQMTRICQDAQGHFWASPPLLAGTGISITPAATGLTISASGAGGMTYVAGGTTHVPTGSIAANDCATLQTTTSSTTPSADGVLPTDVVSWSMQTGAATTGFAQVGLRAIPSTDSIQWRFCNAGTTAYSPNARDINWYVARRIVVPVAARRRVVHRRGKKQ